MEDRRNKVEIDAFIEAINSVLNSNTFLLSLSLDYETSLEDLKEEFSHFVKSGNLKTQILEQDAESYGNYQRQAEKQGSLGNLHKNSFELQVRELKEDKKIGFLQALLTTQTDIQFLQSPYNKQLSKEEAHKVLNPFLQTLIGEKQWKLYKLSTNFLHTKEEERELRRKGKNIMSYFYDLFGDTALLFSREDNKAFLLLTNGSD